MNPIIQNAIEQVVDLLIEQKGLFAKGVTKEKVMSILNGEEKPKASKAKKQVEESEEDASTCPEGWDEKKWKAFQKKMSELEGEELLNVVTHKTNNGKKKSGFVIDETHHLCAPKDQEEKLTAVVDFLNSGETEEKSEEEAAEEAAAEDEDEKEESEDEKEESEAADDAEESNDFIEGYDEKKLASLKKAIGKLAKGEFMNIATIRKVEKTAANEKKMVFDAKLKLAMPKLANEKEQKEYNNRVKKMME